ncbi:hypothetical protein BU26DRAFT_557933 [Trematosphaeria pertusa]|uniref:Extracellular membrane protein CFEM domain-containing protein n=1 Tax=Trematosphaeria pertusa TaxID=390896 RepID=A0A6A6J2B4_9PLEO|nr:uncharacterized protein BU26DRAFT_557933 [Trematosphaeria pertusa]KAF2256487.1 hypothetical protein BU26DRAFT_557933 [Trematosphaeria pertusa]
MKRVLALLRVVLFLQLQLAAAAPDAQITARAALHARQDPPQRQHRRPILFCDFPATLTRSASFAQCCAPSSACDFFSTCSAGTLFAESTSVFCDQGYCNTGVIVSTTGAKSGESFLGCWPTSLGTAAFSVVHDIGSAPIATPTGQASSQASSGNGSSSGTAEASDAGSATESPASTGTSTAESAANSTGAAAIPGAQPLTGIVGLVAGLLALL